MVQLDELLKNCHACEVVDFPIAIGSLLLDSLKSATRLLFSLMMSTLQRTDYHCVLWLSCCWYGSTTNPVGITPDLPWFTQLLLKLDCTIVHWTSEHLIKRTNAASCTVLYSVGTRTLRSHKCKCLFDCEGLGSTFIRFRARKSGLASCLLSQFFMGHNEDQWNKNGVVWFSQHYSTCPFH